MSSRRLAVAAAAVLVAAVALVAVGRWERSRQLHAAVSGIASVRRRVGPLDNPSLAGFRKLPAFDCLLYRRGANPFALELCVDPAGRVVEAFDRRAAHRKIWTVRFEPSASTVRVDEAEVQRLLRRMTA